MLETFPGQTNISFYEREKEKDLRRMSHMFIPCFDQATLWYCHNKKLEKSEIYECKQGEAEVQSTD